MTHVLYLHGFGSGPKTAKGTALGQRLAGRVRSYAIPDLEAGDFFSLTMERICDRAAAAVAALPEDEAPVLLIGSSLGGYTAALLAAQGRIPRASALLLIAPAFGFGERWAEHLGIAGVAAWRRDGQRMFFHHASQQERPLGVGFLDSAERLPGFPLAPEIPVVIVHGRRDDTVDWRMSRRYADQDADIEFHLVDGDHRLTDQRHEDLITWCAGDLIDRLG
jgi:pimeloyl-ACP methyl ester carboxylesterase